MLSLGVTKGGVIPPTDEDRRRIIKQMKVRTTLRGDKSWIHHHNSDSEDEEKKSSSLSGRASGGSPASKPSTPQSNRSPASKPQSGYLIRGVFTRTIDKTSSTPDPPAKEAQKSCSSTPKGPSSGRSSSGYRMTTEDYKKLAPYNIKQKPVDVDEEDVPFTADEQKKRAEAANSVLRRTASRERAYVLSAAKKSNGSPTQEFPPMFAKRIEIEEEEGQQRRSAAVPDSCRLTPDDSSTNGLRRTTAGSPWNQPKPTAASPSGKSQTTSSESPERIPTAAEIRNGEPRQASTGKCSPEATSQHGEGDKPPKELPEPFPGAELAPRATLVATNGSHPAHPEASNGFYSPKSHSGLRDGPTDKLHHPYETSHCLDDAKPDPARSSLQSDVPSPPTERAPLHLEDTEHSLRGSALGYEERSSTRESRCPSGECPAHSEPRWSQATSSPGFTPGERWEESTRASDGCKVELSQEGFLDSTNHTEKGQNPSGHVVHPEPPRLKEHNERDPSRTRSSSLPRDSSITAPETQGAKECDPCQERTTPGYEEQTHPTTESHPESPGDWRHTEPSPVAASRSNFSSQESALGTYELQGPVPLYPDRQPLSASLSPASHRIPAYVDSQVFSTRRAAPDYEGRSSPRSSAGAWGHCEFHPAAERHDSLPRDPPLSVSPRSHRVPFYMDTLNCHSTRLLSSSSERICAHSSPVASGYQPDSSAAGRGVLFVKEYVNTGGFSASPRHGSLVDLTDVGRATYGHHSYLSSAPLLRPSEPVCSYCSREIRDCPKIIIEHLNIYCHEYCFRCGICHKAMGDLLDKIFIHRDTVHCDKCYEKLF